MDKINKMNYFHRVFLGWLAGEIADGRVVSSRSIADMAPIDLKQNRDIFDQFLIDRNQRDNWQRLEAQYGPIEVLTYFRD